MGRPVFALSLIFRRLLHFFFLRLVFSTLHVEVLELFLKFFNEVGVLDVDLFGNRFRLKDGTGAFLQESHMSSDDILSFMTFTSLWNMISCFCYFFIMSPAKDFLQLKTSFSAKP